MPGQLKETVNIFGPSTAYQEMYGELSTRPGLSRDLEQVNNRKPKEAHISFSEGLIGSVGGVLRDQGVRSHADSRQSHSVYKSLMK